MAIPDVLGIPAPASIITALSVAANTIVAALIILSVGLATLMLAMRTYKKPLQFLSELQSTISSAFLPTLTIAIAGIFLALLLEYLTPGHSFFFAASNLTKESGIFYALSYLARIIFLAGISLAAGAAFITIANHMRPRDERVTIFGLRIVCGAVLAASCARIAGIWLTSAHHPANPELSGFIIGGSLIAAAIIGTAILGILRPRVPMWSIATAALLLVGITASTYVSIYLADEAYRAAAPTFGAAYRMQPVLMALFFTFTALALVTLGKTLRWWFANRD